MFYVDFIARSLAKEQLKGNIMRKHLPSITSLPSFQTSPNTHQLLALKYQREEDQFSFELPLAF